MEKSPSWSRAHDWKSCRPLKGLEGSNPSFSAKMEQAQNACSIFLFSAPARCCPPPPLPARIFGRLYFRFLWYNWGSIRPVGHAAPPLPCRCSLQVQKGDFYENACIWRGFAPAESTRQRAPLSNICPGSHFRGSEANVAVSLANFGVCAGVVTILPDNAIGHACLAELRRFGLDVSQVRFAAGRMGTYYLEEGANQLPAKVLYDRDGSAIALAPPDSIAWEQVLDGVDWFHVSGITPAISQNTLEMTRRGHSGGQKAGHHCLLRL